MITEDYLRLPIYEGFLSTVTPSMCSGAMGKKWRVFFFFYNTTYTSKSFSRVNFLMSPPWSGTAEGFTTSLAVIGLFLFHVLQGTLNTKTICALFFFKKMFLSIVALHVCFNETIKRFFHFASTNPGFFPHSVILLVFESYQAKKNFFSLIHY